MAHITSLLANETVNGNAIIDFADEFNNEYRIEICPEEVINYYESQHDPDMLERAENWAKHPQWMIGYEDMLIHFISMCQTRWQPLLELELENAN